MIIPAQKRKFYGFTLIELLIVIAILGILAAAVLVAINPAKRQNQAKDAQIKNDIGSIATALQAYYTSPGQGSFPTAAQGLNFLVTNQDLKTLPTPPTGSDPAYLYTVSPGTCDNLPTGTACAEADVYAKLLDPAVAGNVWCWESVSGKAAEKTIANCTDFNPAT